MHKGNHLMCPACWRQVPAPLQVAVTRTWFAFQNRKNPEAGRSALAAYRQARDAAFAALPARTHRP